MKHLRDLVATVNRRPEITQWCVQKAVTILSDHRLLLNIFKNDENKWSFSAGELNETQKENLLFTGNFSFEHFKMLTKTYCRSKNC